MDLRRGRRAAQLLVVMVAGVTVAVATPAAHASVSGLATISGSVTVYANTDYSLSCPSGTKAISAGESMDLSATGTVTVVDSYPGAEGPRWFWRFYNYGRSPQTVFVHMTCAAVSGPYSVARSSVSAEPGETSSVNVDCPAGTLAMGGGYKLQFGTDPSFVLNASRPTTPFLSDTPKGWGITVTNHGTVQRTAWINAICVTVYGAGVISQSVNVAPGQFGFPLASCRNGKTAASGGWYAGSTSSWAINESNRFGTGWGAYILNPESTSVKAVAFAICIPT